MGPPKEVAVGLLDYLLIGVAPGQPPTSGHIDSTLIGAILRISLMENPAG